MSGGPQPVWKKYTTGSIGIWEKIRQTLTLVPNRSSGNPIVTKYRVPPPGNQEKKYSHPDSLPKNDIVNNSYFKRDTRRSYPKISSFNQNDVGLLLNLGSVNNPTQELIGEEGEKRLAVYKEHVNGDIVYLSDSLKTVDLKKIFANGAGIAPNLSTSKKQKLQVVHDNGIYSNQGTEYPCRMFNYVQ